MHIVTERQTDIVTFGAFIAGDMDQYPISESCKCTIESIGTEIKKTTAWLLCNTGPRTITAIRKAGPPQKYKIWQHNVPQ